MNYIKKCEVFLPYKEKNDDVITCQQSYPNLIDTLGAYYQMMRQSAYIIHLLREEILKWGMAEIISLSPYEYVIQIEGPAAFIDHLIRSKMARPRPGDPFPDPLPPTTYGGYSVDTCPGGT